MPDVMDSSVPEYKQDEVALLMRDLGIINKAKFGLNVPGGGTSAGTNREGIIEHFGYSTQMLDISNDKTEFFDVLKVEIDQNRPVLLSFNVFDGKGVIVKDEFGNPISHITIGDGYKYDPTGQSFHINMGWGGYQDDFYYLNRTNDVFDTTKLTMTHHIMPCSSANNDCYETLSAPETTDSINGSTSSGQYTISGQFNRDGDVDVYSVYLKGATQIIGSSQQGFFISVYNAKYELVNSLPSISQSFDSGKHYIKASFSNAQGVYPYIGIPAAYTMNISTQALTDAEKAEIDSRDTLPVINNDFKTLYIKNVRQIRIDSADPNGDEVSLSAASSNANVAVSVDKDVLTITPMVINGSSEITVKATANGKETTKTFLLFITDSDADPTKLWQTSKADAVYLAKSQNKKILLLVGRDGCYNTNYMRNTVCESASPPIKSLLQQNFILWYCDFDNQAIRAEWDMYFPELTDPTLPFICVIDPNSDTCLDTPTSNLQDSQTFYSRLLKYVTPATRIINLNGNLTFENVQVNTKKTLTFTISNTGNSPLTVSSIIYPAGFTGNWTGGTIAAGGSQIVTVTFAPTAAQTYSGTVTVNSDKTSGTYTLPISGTGILQYTVTFQPGTGGTITGSTSQTVNQGGNCSAVTAVQNSGYQFVNWTGTGGFVSTTTNPLTVSNVTANMTITANFQQIPTRIINLISGNLDFGPVTSGTTKQLMFNITNSGNSTLTVSSITYPAGFTGNWSGTIAAGSSHDVTVTFAPTALQNYSGTVTVNSDKTSGTNTLAISGIGSPPQNHILTSVSIIEGPVSMSENSFADYKAAALFADGTTQDVTASAIWTENSSYASMDTSVKGRMKTATVSVRQTVTLTARYTYNGVTKIASFPVTIVPKLITSFTVTGASAIKGGSYSDYTATAAFDDGTTQDVTKTSVWTENSTYASMDYAVKGRMKTAAVRTEQKVTLTARYTYKGVAKTASVPVTITVPPALVSVSVSGTDRVNENSSADYKAVAAFADGTTQDITASAVWTENSAYASMDTSVRGRLKTAAVSSDQTATLTAKYTYNGITQTSSIPVRITPKILDSVTVTGVSSVMGGAAGDYRAAAVFADGTTQDITASAVWTENSNYASTDTSVRGRLKTVSVSSGQTVTLTTRYTYKSVTKTASVSVMITVPSPLKEVSVTGPPAVNESSFGNYTATAVFEDGSTADITAFAAWSENSAYASMDTAVKGRLKTAAVTADQNITLTVRYTLNGITKTTSMPVLIRSKNSLPLFFEFETLTIKEILNIPYVDVQDMALWGSERWSGGKQLFCGAGANQGSIIKLLLPVNKSGRYTFDLYATKAPDFSQIQVMIDGKQIGATIDLYDSYVIPSGKISLGIIDLLAETHELSFIVVGKNSASSNYSFGLDALSLSPSL